MKLGKILIVEDEPLWQGFLQEPLQDEYDLTVVSNRAEAKDALTTAAESGEPFDVVTVDIGLDRGASSFEGEDILAFVRKGCPGTKCIVVTGHQEVDPTRLRNYFKEYEVFDYISKADFDLAYFKQVMDKAFYLYGYRILGELGRGGMGVVYKAVEPNNENRVVALKMLHANQGLSSEDAGRQLARFKREVETIRRLDHPNIVTIYDYLAPVDTGGQIFFVMEYLPGKTLEAILAVGEKLSLSQIVKIGRQLCDALAYAHRQQIIHRDVKPSNIILLPAGDVKITDFGIAKVLDTDGTLTRTEEIIGTFAYMPPEQILNTKQVDHRVDIYATGVVLYELLTGQRPYTDPMLKIQADPTPLRQLKPDLPEGLALAIMKALAREPDERYQAADEMAEALNTTASDHERNDFCI